MNYLQEIRILLLEKSYEQDFVKLGERLSSQGIELLLGLTEEKTGREVPMDGGMEGREPMGPKCQCGERKDNGRLWITDSSPTAHRLLREGKYVLAFFHKGNEGKDFSGLKYAIEEPGELDAEYFENTYRRLAGLPWDILETDRCILRETTEEDVEAFCEIYADPEVTRYTGAPFSSVEQEKQYVKEYIEKVYAFYNFGVWTVVRKNTDTVIGRAGLSYRAGFEQPELGFMIGRPWQGRGLAWEVCRAILCWGREQFGPIEVNAMVCPENNASLRLCKKLGFVVRETLVWEGQTCLRLSLSLSDCNFRENAFS